MGAVWVAVDDVEEENEEAVEETIELTELWEEVEDEEVVRTLEVEVDVVLVDFTPERTR